MQIIWCHYIYTLNKLSNLKKWGLVNVVLYNCFTFHIVYSNFFIVKLLFQYNPLSIVWVYIAFKSPCIDHTSKDWRHKHAIQISFFFCYIIFLKLRKLIFNTLNIWKTAQNWYILLYILYSLELILKIRKLRIKKMRAK